MRKQMTDKAIVDRKLKPLLIDLWEAVKAYNELLRQPGEGATEAYDRVAELFCKETGKMAPGKSVPIEVAVDDQEERIELWEKWWSDRHLRVVNALRELEEL